MDSSTTSRQCPVLKINLYFSLLPFLAPDTAITMLRTKAVRNWVLNKCAGTDSAQVTTLTYSSHFVVPDMGTAASVAVAQIYSKRKLHYYNQTVFFKDWTQTPCKSQWIQKAGDELPLLPLAFLTAGMCDVVIPTLSNSEKISPFCCLLTFSLLY